MVETITLSVFFKDVDFEWLKECFVVLIFAYNLFLKRSIIYSHLDVQWVIDV